MWLPKDEFKVPHRGEKLQGFATVLRGHEMVEMAESSFPPVSE